MIQDTKQELRFIKLSSDTTFKYLYKDESTRGWINNIIKQKFNLDLNDYTLVDNELNTGNRIKDYRLDLKLEKGSTVVIIEMNQDYYDFVDVKNYQYLYRVAGNRFDSGETYKPKPTKLVLFNNFKNQKDKTSKTGNYMFMDPISKIVIEDIESYEIYLPNFKNLCYDNSEVDVSLSLFNAESYKQMRELTNNPEDLKIIKKLEDLAMNEEFIYDYDHEAVIRKTENSIRYEGYEEGKKDGIEQGIEKGIEQGSKEKQLEIAKSMLIDGMEVEIISKYTNLPVEVINSLK